MSQITFEELKTKYQNKLQKDNEVICKVISKLKDGYLVDVNDEWEGFIPNSHFMVGEGEESFRVLVIAGPDKSDRYMVSPKALKEKEVWQRLEKLKEENTALKVTISKAIKGGAEVFIDGVRAFLPGRYIRLPGLSQDNWARQEVNVLIEEIDYKEKKLILNQKKAIDIERQKRAEVTIQKLKEGEIVEAPILRIADFGVFVDLGGLDGLIPASELSWGRFNHPKEIVKVGQTLRARVFRIEKENQRVALTVKQLLGDPWEEASVEFALDQIILGKVIGYASFGIFVELKPGIEALLHSSEIPEGTEKPKIGSRVNTKIIKIDIEQRKIGLTVKDVEQRSTITKQHTTQVTNEEQRTTSDEGQVTSDDISFSLPEVSLDSLALCDTERE